MLVAGFVFLALSAAGLALSPAVVARPRPVPGLAAHLLLLPVWAVGAWLLHRTLNRTRPARDPFLLPCAMVLMGWGVVAIDRLLPEFGARQLAWFIAAVVVIYEIVQLRRALDWLRRFRLAWLTLGLLLLALTLLFGTNPSGDEARLWLGCCGQYFQPSELLRLLLIAYLASYFADRLMPGSDRPARTGLLPIVLPLLLVWGLAVALLAAQRDLGAGSLFLALLALLLYLVFRRWEAPAAGAVLLVAAGAAAMQVSPVVRARIDTWLNPWADPLATSYQTLQGLIAMAAGGLAGAGPGFGQPGVIPAAHTDFIFAAIVEEWGLVGGLGLLGTMVVLTARGLRAATRARDSYAAVLAAGLSISIGLQATLILAGVLRLLPLTGIPLPLVSYGGSSMLTTALALGILLRVSASTGESPRFGRSIQHLHGAGLAAFAALALALGWWVIVRGDHLRHRPENPRPAQATALASGEARARLGAGGPGRADVLTAVAVRRYNPPVSSLRTVPAGPTVAEGGGPIGGPVVVRRWRPVEMPAARGGGLGRPPLREHDPGAGPASTVGAARAAVT